MAAITQGASSAEVRGSPPKAQCLVGKTLNSLPVELVQKVFDYLNDEDLARASGVCKEWKACVEGLLLGRERRLGKVYGKGAWAHLGDVGKEPPLPKRIDEILAEPCPAALGLERFGQTIGETHILVLIPETLDGQPLTLGRFKTLLDQRDGPKITTWNPGGVENTPPSPSYWALISKDCIRDSKNKTYDAQKQMIMQLGESYRLPKVIEMAFGFYLQEKVHGGNLYDKNSWTRCEEEDSNRHPVAVRGFGSGGGVFSNFAVAYDLVGVGVSRKFSF